MPDSLDKQLVLLLGQDGRQSSEKLAKQLKVSAATVRRRIRKLMQSNFLRIVGAVNHDVFGYPLAVVINLDIDHDKIEKAAQFLVERKEIRWLSITTGRYDIITLARFSSNGDLTEFLTKHLSKIDGLRDSETFICLDFKKGIDVPLSCQ